MHEVANFYTNHTNDRPPAGVAGLTTAAAIQARSGLPWLRLRLPFWMPHQIMLEEARRMKECFIPHRSYKETNSGWYSLCVHGISSAHTGYHAKYGYANGADAPYDWTDICKFCPVTHAFFRDLFGYHYYRRVRFMLVTPGGYVLPHRDLDIDQLDAINIALNQPLNCDFVMENAGTLPFEPGTAMMLSLSRRHIVWNRSNEDRYHIIVHGMRNSAIWDEIIVDSYNQALLAA